MSTENKAFDTIKKENRCTSDCAMKTLSENPKAETYLFQEQVRFFERLKINFLVFRKIENIFFF